MSSKSPRRPRSAACRWFRPQVERFEDRLAPSVSWINSSSGFWDDPTSWSGSAVPTATDDVIINQTGPLTVTVRDARAINSLTTASGNALTLAGGGALTEAATSVLSGGLTL